MVVPENSSSHVGSLAEGSGHVQIDGRLDDEVNIEPLAFLRRLLACVARVFHFHRRSSIVGRQLHWLCLTQQTTFTQHAVLHPPPCRFSLSPRKPVHCQGCDVENWRRWNDMFVGSVRGLFPSLRCFLLQSVESSGVACCTVYLAADFLEYISAPDASRWHGVRRSSAQPVGCR